MSKNKKAVAAVPTAQKPAEQRDQRDFSFHREASHMCGCTLSASREGNAIADVMAKKPSVRITKFPSIIRVDGDRMIEFDMDEIAEALGLEPGEYGPYDFEVEMSTHYGRQVRLDDKVLLFADPEDAANYLGFDLHTPAVASSAKP